MQKRIGDLISVNEQAALVKGVQLEWYGDPKQEKENERLSTGYIFSSGRTTPGALSALDIFEKIWTGLNQPGSRNVFTVIAKYGHGKSHFALVLANYFGRGSNDPVLEGILRQIELCSDKNTAFLFRSFKKQADKPQLVIRLSGHNFDDLRQGFLRALRRSLDEHETSRSYAIKAVSERAVEWLRSLNKDQRDKAQEYLDEHHQMDLAALIEALENYDLTKAIIARELSEAILGWPLDFGNNVNLREIINQVVDDLCTADNAPFHKMVILFDELGVYSENWCHNRMAAGFLAPQQILEACDDQRGKVCLVGFLQREMSEFVKTQANQEEFRKWAERFPTETCFRLETSLEQVIERLLIKKDKVWKQFMLDFMPEIEKACDSAWAILPSYQGKSEIWDKSTFTRILGVGAFPIHPITIGLLCNLTFTQGSRTIIGFVNETILNVQDQPPSQSGKLNWVFPICLVDEFENNFEGQEAQYSLYANALKRLGPNAPPILYLVLKALFLFEAGSLKRYTSQTHASVLAQLCGLQDKDIQESLKQLAEEYFVIRFSQARKEYEFTGIGTSPIDIRQQLLREVASKTVLSLSDKLHELGLVDQIPLVESEAMGFKSEYAVEGDEWKLEPRFIDAGKLDADRIKRMLTEAEMSGLSRGLVVYAVSVDGVELDNAQEQAPRIINELRSNENPYPVVIAIPHSPAVGLEQEVLLRQALKDWGETKRSLYGEGYADAVKDSDRRLKDLLESHFRDVRYCVAGIVEQRLKIGESNQLERIADRLFEQAFPYRVPARSNIMKSSSSKGNTAVAEVARHLLMNDVEFGKLSQATQNLVNAVLIEAKDKWGILYKNRLQEPTNDRVLRGWKVLDDAVHENKPVSLHSLSVKLRGIPYGYDDLTLTLLYAAWIGKNKNDLSFAGLLSKKSPSRPLTPTDFQDQLKKAKDFIAWIRDGNVQIQRPGLGRKRKATEYIKLIEDARDYVEARKLLDKAVAILADISGDEDIRVKLTNAIDRLATETNKIDEYWELVKYIHQLARKTESIAALLGYAEKLPQRPVSDLDFDDNLFAETRDYIEGKTRSTLEKYTQRQLKRIEDYGAVCRDLEILKDAFHKSGREDLKQNCVQALARINDEYERLKAQQKESLVVAEIDTIKVDGMGLASCRDSATRVELILATELSNASDKTRQKVERKLQHINKIILGYEQRIAELPELISASTDDLRSAKQLRDEILGREWAYANTLEMELLQQYKQQAGDKINELEEFDRQREARRVAASTHLKIVQERAAHVIQARAFDEAAREFQSILALPSLPQGIELNDEEERQVKDFVEKAKTRVASLFNQLKQPIVQREAAVFERRRNELQHAVEAFSNSSNLPNEWQQELIEALEGIERDFSNWQDEQGRLKEERRRVEEEKDRQEHNRTIVKDTLKQTSRTRTLREIKNALAIVSTARNQLEPPCEEQASQLENENNRLGESESSIRSWVTEKLPVAVLTAWVPKAIQELRKNVVLYESLCGDDATLSNTLTEGRVTLDRRNELLNRLVSLEQQATSLSRCQDILTQLVTLKSEYADGIEQILTAEARLQTKLEKFRAEERRKTEKWLAQFQAVKNGSISAKQANELLRELEGCPVQLEKSDEDFILSSREKLYCIRDTDLVSRITDDFSKLKTPQQRAECLLKIAEICKAEGLSSEYFNKLVQLLELQTIV